MEMIYYCYLMIHYISVVDININIYKDNEVFIVISVDFSIQKYTQYREAKYVLFGTRKQRDYWTGTAFYIYWLNSLMQSFIEPRNLFFRRLLLPCPNICA